MVCWQEQSATIGFSIDIVTLEAHGLIGTTFSSDEAEITLNQEIVPISLEFDTQRRRMYET